MNFRLSEHFVLDEFVHHTKSGIEFEPDENFYLFVRALEEFRTWYNRPININSCYRPPEYNKLVGGSSNSSHIKALAIDFSLPSEYYSFDSKRKNEFLNNIKNKWCFICAKYNPKHSAQVNYYDTYIHIGFGLNKNNSFIDKRKNHN